MRREMSQAETGDPSPDLLRIGTVEEALAGLPVAGGRQLRQLRGALAQPGGDRGREGDDGLAGEVVGRHKAVYGPCGAAPSDGVADEHGAAAVPVRGCALQQWNVAQALIAVFAADTAVRVRPVQILCCVGLGGCEGQIKKGDASGIPLLWG